MIDVREEILARIRAVLETVPGLAQGSNGEIRGAGRNRDDVSATARPAAILYDGLEERIPESNPNARPRRAAVQLMELRPAVRIFVGERTEGVGALASQFRNAVLTAVCTDATLIDLTGGSNGNGDIRYEGCEMETETGDTRAGTMTLHFALVYVFRLADLTGG